MIEHDWYGPCDALLPDGGCSVCRGPIKIKASDWCSAHREWSPCPDCETEATIARLTQEVAGLRLMLREVATTNTAGIDHALRCQRERDAARAEAEEAAAAYNAARRDLATETATRAALRTQESRIMGILADAGVPVGDVVRGVELLAARARGAACCPTCGLPVHPEHDACRLSREGAR